MDRKEWAVTSRAARLYALALLANMDEGGADSDAEREVVRLAIDRARWRLQSDYSVSYSELPSLAACMVEARRQIMRHGR